MRYVVLSLLLFMLGSCNRKEQKAPKGWIERSTYPNGKIETERIYFTGPEHSSTYLERAYYDNGAREFAGVYMNGKEEGVFEWRYSNGNPKWVEKYHEGVVVDTTRCYYESGELKREVAPSLSGMKRLVEYYTTGEIKIITYIKNSEYLDSIWTGYFKNGRIKELGIIDEGKKKGYWKLYNEAAGKLDSMDQAGKPKVVVDFEEEEIRFAEEKRKKK